MSWRLCNFDLVSTRCSQVVALEAMLLQLGGEVHPPEASRKHLEVSRWPTYSSPLPPYPYCVRFRFFRLTWQISGDVLVLGPVRAEALRISLRWGCPMVPASSLRYPVAHMRHVANVVDGSHAIQFSYVHSGVQTAMLQSAATVALLWLR
jgi:hypothetical protein